jgi:hypothetical protein
MSDLEQIITDSVNDSINDVSVEETPDVSAEASPEPVEASVSDSDAEPVGEDASSSEVSSPANVEAQEAVPAAPQDDFAKLAGMPQIGVGGRENRIPYSRVKKITEKAVSEIAEAAVGRKLNPGEKALDVVKAHVAQLPELQTKVTDYETRLGSVGQFENIMANDPQQFLSMLARLPAYKEFFEFVGQAAQAGQATVTPADATQAAPVAPAVDSAAGMPEPDEELSDGSKVYSMEGLKALLAWNAAQTESRVTTSYEKQLKELQSKYDPIASDWQEQRRIAAALPVIRKQLEEAKTWALFNESEEEILAVLDSDKQISLEGAYRQVVFPKLIADRNKVRQDVLQEVKAAPTSTSVVARAASKPSAPSDGPRKLEDIIKAQVETIRR